MEKTVKNQKGITLIALVVTIVILLILAGVTIRVIMGEGGLINRAKLAQNQTEQGKQKDIDEIEGLAEKAEKMANAAKAGTVVAKPRGWTSTKVTPIADGYGGTVPLPSGFYYIGGNYNTGLVISDKQGDTMEASGITMGNQFVWIPVPNEEAFTCTFFDENGQPYTEEKVREAFKTEIDEIWMEIETKKEPYKAQLEGQFRTAFPQENFPNNPPEGWVEEIPVEIPSNATADDYEDYMNEVLNLLEYSLDKSAEEAANQQIGYLLDDYVYEYSIYFEEPYTQGYPTEAEEYNTMKNQVLQYGGFYIGRYEAGINSTTLRTVATSARTVVSKKGVAPYNYVPWGKENNDPSDLEGVSGAAYLAKNMYNNHESITSTLVYGCQWDAMCRYIGDSQRTTPKKSKAGLTGSVETDLSKNIYDLAGNCLEWTMEIAQVGRCRRGGRRVWNSLPSSIWKYWRIYWR